MKRVARIVGILGGIGAVVWAMRDRFVSVAISREPEPPAFRVQETAHTREKSTPEHPDITTVSGIGPVYATRLEEIGVSTVAALAGSRPEPVAAAAQIPLSRAVGWIEEARSLIA